MAGLAPDSARVIGLIRDSLELDLRGAEPLGRGQGRTYLCRLGKDAVVVKWGLDPDLAEKIPYVASQFGELGRRGCDVPAYTAHGPLPGQGYAWVQQYLPGTPAATLDATLLSDLVDLTGRWTNAPRGVHRTNFAQWVPAVVFRDAAGWWATARVVSPEVAAFCRRLRAWVGEPTATSTRHDYVHGDLNLQNILTTGGRLAAVVDLENLGVGDRSVDVARLLYEWHRLARTGPPGLAMDGHDRLVALGRDSAGEAGWRQAVAYELVSRLGWRSEHQLDIDVDAVHAICTDVLDGLTVERAER
jgi:phosphotransferase family enzyme